jgi:hypothetical protein
MRRRRGGWIIAVAFTVLAGCGKDTSGPVAGPLHVKLTSPNSGQDSAMVLTVRGPSALTSAVAAPGLRVFSQTLGPTTKVAIVGRLNGGAVLLTIGVSDVGQVGRYSAVIDAVARPDYQLRSSLSGYALSVTR